LGEYLVLNGLFDENESLVNDGIAALTSGAGLPEPSVACLMDLGWVLISRNLDALALPYLSRATDIAPSWRDISTLKALAEIGIGNRDAAIRSLMLATTSPAATDNDRKLLAALRDGEDLKELRKNQLLQKKSASTIPSCLPYSVTEQCQAAIAFLKPLYERNPGDWGITEALAQARYSAGQLDRAKPLLDAIVGADPANARAWTMFGLIARKSKQPDIEIAMYPNALAVDPTHSLALVNLASRLMEEDPHAGKPLLDTALATMAPDDEHRPIALHLMGNYVGIVEKD
jgi:tetratricopeptide (TPR) repeat protein